MEREVSSVPEPTTRRAPWVRSGEPTVPDISDMAQAVRARLARRRSPARSGPIDLAAVLMARGAVTASDLAVAQAARSATDAPLSDILLAHGLVSEIDLMAALADCHGLALSDLAGRRPAADLAPLLPAPLALSLEAVPTERIGSVLVIATCRPDRAEAIRAALPPGLRPILTLAPRDQVTAAQIALYGEGLARVAEGQAPQRDSCRGWRPRRASRVLAVAGLTMGVLWALFPATVTAFIFAIALTVFAGNMVLKATALAAALRAERSALGTHATPNAQPLRPPMVSILVPLYEEADLAATLVANLARLDYPPERLEVLLAVEDDDRTTHAALSSARLPPWFRVVPVPDGQPRTKPRALNFALNFARGEIIGVYDAEDRPEPDQITRITSRFAKRPPQVACLQGRLDYYNARHNLLSRLFSIEYANWFRVLLPGVQHLGLVVPLGGTTLFLRRAALTGIGGWDAHNVTEDAELGLRLARRGYRTEIVETTTFEEANAAVLPWIRQRARWQKGYLMTWATAMRAPVALWRDLGTMRFLALQVQFLFAVAGFLVAPLLWSLMIKPFGLDHPLDAWLGPTGYGILATAFVCSIVLSVALSFRATRAPHLRHLRPWILLSELYFLLATISAWKAVAEMLSRPFWWAKTAHGRFGGDTVALNSRPSALLPSDAPQRRSTGDP